MRSKKVDIAYVDPDASMDRFYSPQLTRSLFGEVRVEPQWVRQETLRRYRLDWYKKELDATIALIQIANAKMGRGYALSSAARMNVGHNIAANSDTARGKDE